MSWEDRITKEQMAACDAAFEKFRASKKRRTDEHILYETLTNNGVFAEEADELINLELQDE